MYIYATLCIGACTALPSCTLCRPRSFLQRRRARPTHECRMWELFGLRSLGVQSNDTNRVDVGVKLHTLLGYFWFYHTQCINKIEIALVWWNKSIIGGILCEPRSIGQRPTQYVAIIPQYECLLGVSIVRFSDRSSQFLTISLVLLLGAFW